MLNLIKTMFVIDVLMVAALALFRIALLPQHRAVVSPRIFGIALLTPAVALFCGNLYLFCLYLVALVAFNARSRAELAATYVFILALTPNVAVETGVGGIYLLSVSAVQAMGLGALVAFLIGRSGRSLVQTSYDTAALLLFSIFMVIATHEPSLTTMLRSATVNLFAIAGPYLLVSRGISSRDNLERLVLRLALGGVVVALTACFQAVKHWLLFEIYFSTLHATLSMTSATLAMRAGLLRTGGSILDYSSAGLFLAAVLTLIPLLRSHFRPMPFLGLAATLIGGLLATQSRGAWIAAIVGQIAIMVYRGHWARVIVLAGISVAAEAYVLTFATSGRLADIAGRNGEASGTVDYRRRLFSRGMDQIRAHPLVGQSQEQLVLNLPDLVQGQHIVDFVNAHLFVAMASGIPLFLVWCTIWLTPLRSAWQRRKLPIGENLAEVPVAIIVPVMTALAATSIMDRNLVWPIIALGVAGPCGTLLRRTKSPTSSGLVAQRFQYLNGATSV